MNLEERKIALQEKWFEFRKEALQLEKEKREKEKAAAKRFTLNPVTATIMVALIGFLGTGIGTIFNNKARNELEQRRFESDLIKKSLAEHTQEDKIKSLRLLIRLHLIHDGDVKSGLDSLLINTDSAIQALPSSGPHIMYDRTTNTFDEFKSFVERLNFTSWKPGFIVLHNTTSPNLREWKSTSGKARMDEFARYYHDIQHLKGGPHLFIGDDTMWIFNPLTKPGVHSPSWNNVSIGIMMIGDYQTEPFDEKVKANTAYAIAVLCKKLGLPPTAIKFHSEDPLSTHKECPGKNVDKNELIQLVQNDMSKN